MVNVDDLGPFAVGAREPQAFVDELDGADALVLSTGGAGERTAAGGVDHPEHGREVAAFGLRGLARQQELGVGDVQVASEPRLLLLARVLVVAVAAFDPGFVVVEDGEQGVAHGRWA